MNNWIETTLKEICDISIGRTPPRKEKEWFSASKGIPWISISDMGISKKYISDAKEYLTQEAVTRFKIPIIEKNTIILSFKMTVGRVCITGNKMLSNEAIAHLNNCKIETEFLYYYLKNFNYSTLSSTSSIVKSAVNSKILKEIPVYFPEDRETQKAIAEFISIFDKKLELNINLIKTLEEIAKTIFKSWFIDFDPVKAKVENRTTGLSDEIDKLFPCSFQDSELGVIPKNWKVSVLSDFGNIICGKTPSTKDSKNFDGSYPFITIPDMRNNLLVSKTARTVSEKGANSLKGKLLPAGSVCVSCIATPGIVSLTTQDSFTNQQINSIIPNSAKHKEYLTFAMRTYGNLIASAGSGGTVFANMNTNSFKKLPILVPDNQIMITFSKIVSPILKKIEILINEISLLSEIRDNILPKLLSGKIKITNEKKSN